MKNFLILLSSLFLMNYGCGFVNPVTKAQNLTQKGNFKEAIKILESEHKAKPDSVPIKSILAQTYSDYGLALCQDQNKPPKIKYNLAKENFTMALALNPYLNDAKEMLEMIDKIQASFTANKIE